MLNLSNEVFSALVKYLKGDSSIEQFRAYMVGLRVDKYKLLADADRLFLNEFEGRYAEFSDFDGDESFLKNSLASYVQAEAPANLPATFSSWALPFENRVVSMSVSFGPPVSTRNLLPCDRL